MYLLSLSAGGWLLLIQSVFLRFYRHGWFTSHVAAMMSALIIYASITFLFYRIFIVDERDQKIIDKYINKWHDNPHKKRDLLVASFVAALPYLTMFGIKLILIRMSVPL
jgi:hypothetical protein